MQIFYKMKHGTEYLNYGRDIITGYCRRCRERSVTEEGNPFKILDLGAGHGTDLINCRENIVGGGVKTGWNCGRWKVIRLMLRY